MSAKSATTLTLDSGLWNCGRAGCPVLGALLSTLAPFNFQSLNPGSTGGTRMLREVCSP